MKRADLFIVPMAVALLVTACGSATSPIEEVPALAGPLERLDEAVVTSDYRNARIAIRDLKHLTSEARTSGSLSTEQAQEILAAVTSVAADLRDLQPARKPASPTTTSPTPPESSSEDEGSGEGENQDEGKAKNKHKNDEEPGKSDDAPGHNKDD